MYNLRTNLIDSIIKSLKIDNNSFNTTTIQNLIKDISDDNLQKFYQSLFGNEHSFLNGIDRVAKVAEAFKPNIIEIDEVELKAKELIDLVHGMNQSIYKTHIETGKRFDELLEAVSFPSVSKYDIAILNQVKPHFELKKLISNINGYLTSQVCLEAFKQAIKQNEFRGAIAIKNPLAKLRIKR